MSNESENLVGTIWASVDIDVINYVEVIQVFIECNQTIVSYRNLSEKKRDYFTNTSSISDFKRLFTQVDLLGVLVGTTWCLKANRDAVITVKGYGQSSAGFVVITDQDIAINGYKYSQYEISFFTHLFTKIGNSASEITYQSKIYIDGIDEGAPKYSGILPIGEWNNFSKPNYVAVDMAVEDTKDISLPQALKSIEKAYYFVAFDYKKPGRRGYGKGNLAIALSVGQTFNVMYVEKVIANKLIGKGIKNRGVAINHWQSINEKEYKENDH